MYETQKDILRLTGIRFFPYWESEVNVLGDSFQFSAVKDNIEVVVRVPKDTPLDKFEETVWLQFDKARKTWELDKASNG